MPRAPKVKGSELPTVTAKAKLTAEQKKQIRAIERETARRVKNIRHSAVIKTGRLEFRIR